MKTPRSVRSDSHHRVRSRTRELEPFARRTIDLTKFKTDFRPERLQPLAIGGRNGARIPSFLFPLETLSVTRTVGRGRTNLTFIRPTIVQADAAVPFASFDRTQSPSRAPAIQMHFEPQAYGITVVASYHMQFTIEAFGTAMFRIDGLFGRITNPGVVTVNGRRVITLAFQNVAPADNLFGFIEQTGGGRSNWFSVTARFPMPVIVASATTAT